jgi:hypothetical protein
MPILTTYGGTLIQVLDYKRTQKALASCPFCYGEDDSLPKAPMISLGTRVYLSCTVHEELVPGHCLIVPIQHHLTTLEGDDDVWDEMRVLADPPRLCRIVLTVASQNFMKSLMRMYAEEDKGVVFYETVITLKWQRHSVIECVPVPWEHFDILPGYFKVCILGKVPPLFSTICVGVYLDERSGMVAAQKANRLLHSPRWIPPNDGSQPSIFHGPIRL